MSITDELREYALGWDERNRVRDDLTAIADRIDAEHQKACDDAWDNGYEADYLGIEIWLIEHQQVMEHHGWVKLPKDVNGELVDIGDLVDEMLPFGGYAKPAHVDTMELYRNANGYGWMVKLDAENRALVSPKLLRHHHEPTVEDVLREFAYGLGVPVADSYIAASAAKLREVARFIMHQCNDCNPRCDECIGWNDGECVAMLRMRELGVDE